jgi:hypothetical protein
MENYINFLKKKEYDKAIEFISKIDTGINEIKDKFGNTMLHFAVIELNKEIIKSQNIYIDNQCASTRDIINNVFINLKQLINDVHMKSIVNGHRINLLLNHFDLDPAINTTTVQLLENNSYSMGNGILLNDNVRINSEERKLC